MYNSVNLWLFWYFVATCGCSEVPLKLSHPSLQSQRQPIVKYPIRLMALVSAVKPLTALQRENRETSAPHYLPSQPQWEVFLLG